METTVNTKDEYGNYGIKVSDILTNIEYESKPSEPEIPDEPDSEFIGIGEKAEGENKKYESDGQIAIIPKDFTVSDKNGETSIDNGLVVIAPDESEFVWIPVKDALFDGVTEGKTDSDIPKTAQDAGVKTYTPLAINVETEKEPIYLSINYSFSKNGLYLRYPGQDQYYQGYSWNAEIEPRILDGIDTDTNLKSIGLTTTTFTEEIYTTFNNMINSIRDNGGFYMARYEAGIENNNFVSKKGAEVETGSWYNLYSKSRKYSEVNGITDTVTSNMIYGANWDAMCMWLNDKGVDITTSWDKRITNIRHVQTSGSKYPLNDPNGEEDIVKNLYDLRGNGFEYTMGGIWQARITRGGGYYVNTYDESGISSRATFGVEDSKSDPDQILATRMILFIN